jgi:Proteasome activator pa28 alpha subunit
MIINIVCNVMFQSEQLNLKRLAELDAKLNIPVPDPKIIGLEVRHETLCTGHSLLYFKTYYYDCFC